MLFAPKPENDFADFLRVYYDECRSRFGGIEGIAGKWTFRDLIPGLSDFDTRFLCRDNMAVEDWCRMSSAVGEAHLDLCRRHPNWVRNFEHLPGVNVTWEELASEECYSPEYAQWTYYHTEHPARLASALSFLRNRRWDEKDELYHLGKFCAVYGRYDREIDPGCNLLSFATKYPLHSRIMHYFASGVHAAVCLLEKKNIAGKLDAFEIARKYFPALKAWGIVDELLATHYEMPDWYEEPLLSELDDCLETALADLGASVRECTSLIPAGAGMDMKQWQRALREYSEPPCSTIFAAAKYSRLTKGRLWFYAEAPDHFEASWCMGIELGRIGALFFDKPFAAYWQLKSGERIADPVSILDNLRGNPLTDSEVEGAREFARLTRAPWSEENQKELVIAICNVYDDFYRALHRLYESCSTESVME